MSKVILIDDNGRHHDITQAVREQMGELNHHSGPQFRQQENHRQMTHQAQPQHMQGGMPMGQRRMPQHMQGMQMPQRMHGGMPMPQHMQGMENAMPLPQGMCPEDFAGDDNVRVIPVPVPMNGMEMPQHMQGGMQMPHHMQGERMPQGRSVYGMRMGQPVSMNRGQAQPQMGGQFRQPIPSHRAMGGSPFYQTFDNEF